MVVQQEHFATWDEKTGRSVSNLGCMLGQVAGAEADPRVKLHFSLQQQRQHGDSVAFPHSLRRQRHDQLWQTSPIRRMPTSSALGKNSIPIRGLQ
jgi:hypothetical protein